MTNPIVIALTGDCSCPIDRVVNFQTVEQATQAVLDAIEADQLYWFVHLQGYHVLAVGPHCSGQTAEWKDTGVVSGKIVVSKAGVVVKQIESQHLSRSGVKTMTQ